MSFKAGTKKEWAGCCPGHDQYPLYRNNTRASARAFSKSNKKRRKHTRTILKRDLLKETANEICE